MARQISFDRERADMQLSLAYASHNARAALAALWRLDAGLASIAMNGREVALRQIRLAWWREQGHRANPAEPLAQDFREVQASGGDPASLIDAWEVILTEQDEPLGWGMRGAALFRSAALVSDANTGPVDEAGRYWGLVHAGFVETIALPVALTSFTGRLRPLGVLLALAHHDSRRSLSRRTAAGSPVRIARALWFGLLNR